MERTADDEVHYTTKCTNFFIVNRSVEVLIECYPVSPVPSFFAGNKGNLGILGIRDGYHRESTSDLCYCRISHGVEIYYFPYTSAIFGKNFVRH